MSVHLPRLGDDPASPFPEVATALHRPDGLLAFGGDLAPQRLLNAYAQGIFPWYSQGQPLLWWSPDPRMVFRSDDVRLSSRLRRSLRRSPWIVRADTAFSAVVQACASTPRRGQDGTWITGEMQAAYEELHRLGHAHSIEVFDGLTLVGGLYGVALGRMFFGESMFSGESAGSQVALAALAHRLRDWGWPLIDAQVGNPHLVRHGAEAWPRPRFIACIRELVAGPDSTGPWTSAFGSLPANVLGRASEGRD
jgi:leucyl/phenylalanyl-tRNA--protein transferase